MDTNHSPAQIVATWLNEIAVPSAPPAAVYYHLIPEGTGVPVEAIVAGNSSGITDRSHRGPQYAHYGVQLMGRGDSIAEARSLLTWAIDRMATLSGTTPGRVTIEGTLYLLSSASRFGTIADLGQTEKHRNSMATQDYRVTILKG